MGVSIGCGSHPGTPGNVLNCVLCPVGGSISRSQASSDLHAEFPSASADITEFARLGDWDLGAVSHSDLCQLWECKHISPAGLKGSRRGAGEEAHP